MNDFIINENDLSYKYLYKFSSKFRNAVTNAKYYGLTGALPDNFCEYARKIGFIVTLHITLLILVIWELHSMWVAWKIVGYFTNDKIFSALGWYQRLEVGLGQIGMWMSSAAIAIVSLFFIVMGILKFIKGFFDISGIGTALYNRKVAKQYKRLAREKAKAEKKPGFIAMWLESHHNKFCAKATFEIERKEPRKLFCP